MNLAVITDQPLFQQAIAAKRAQFAAFLQGTASLELRTVETLNQLRYSMFRSYFRDNSWIERDFLLRTKELARKLMQTGDVAIKGDDVMIKRDH